MEEVGVKNPEKLPTPYMDGPIFARKCEMGSKNDPKIWHYGVEIVGHTQSHYKARRTKYLLKTDTMIVFFLIADFDQVSFHQQL